MIYEGMKDLRFPYIRTKGTQTVNPPTMASENRIVMEGANEDGRGGFFHSFKCSSPRGRIYFTSLDTKTRALDDEGDDAGYSYTSLVVAEVRLQKGVGISTGYVNSEFAIVPGSKLALEHIKQLGIVTAGNEWNKLVEIDLKRANVPLMKPAILDEVYVANKLKQMSLRAEVDGLGKLVTPLRKFIKDKYIKGPDAIKAYGEDVIRTIFPNLTSENEFATRAKSGEDEFMVEDIVTISQEQLTCHFNVALAHEVIFTADTARDNFLERMPRLREKVGRAFQYDVFTGVDLCIEREMKKKALAKVSAAVNYTECCALFGSNPEALAQVIHAPYERGNTAKITVDFSTKDVKRKVTRQWAVENGIAILEDKDS